MHIEALFFVPITFTETAFSCLDLSEAISEITGVFKLRCNFPIPSFVYETIFVMELVTDRNVRQSSLNLGMFQKNFCFSSA